MSKNKNEKKIDLSQKYFMNNIITQSKITNGNINVLWDNITSSDEEILKKMNNMFTDTYQIKLNLLYNLLKSDNSLPIHNLEDLIKFFNIISPLNIEYSMGNYRWNHKIIKDKLFLQNSISKQDSNNIFYNKYINNIKKKLIDSKIDFNYFEFKIKRFTKTKDIIWVIDLSQFNKI